MHNFFSGPEVISWLEDTHSYWKTLFMLQKLMKFNKYSEYMNNFSNQNNILPYI